MGTIPMATQIVHRKRIWALFFGGDSGIVYRAVNTLDTCFQIINIILWMGEGRGGEGKGRGR